MILANYHQGNIVGEIVVFNKSGHHIATYRQEQNLVENLEVIEQTSQLETVLTHKAKKHHITFRT